jgi:uncharacterized DUF497 family protein
VEFEWDEEKRKANIAKHGVDFQYAALIFEGPILSRPDHRVDYGEERLISLGMVEDECFVVVHTERSGCTRIISAWKGGTDERRYYAEGLARHASQAGG